MKPKLSKLQSLHQQADAMRRLREAGYTWVSVTEELGISAYKAHKLRGLVDEMNKDKERRRSKTTPTFLNNAPDAPNAPDTPDALKELKKKRFLTFDERQEVLTIMILDKMEKTADRISAIKTMTDLCGDAKKYSPDGSSTTVLSFENPNELKHSNNTANDIDATIHAANNTANQCAIQSEQLSLGIDDTGVVNMGEDGAMNGAIQGELIGQDSIDSIDSIEDGAMNGASTGQDSIGVDELFKEEDGDEVANDKGEMSETNEPLNNAQDKPLDKPLDKPHESNNTANTAIEFSVEIAKEGEGVKE